MRPERALAAGGLALAAAASIAGYQAYERPVPACGGADLYEVFTPAPDIVAYMWEPGCEVAHADELCARIAETVEPGLHVFVGQGGQAVTNCWAVEP